MHHRMVKVNVEHLIQSEPDCPAVRGNPRALEQVFTNLFANAIQAMNETGGKLAIKIQTRKLAPPSKRGPNEQPYVEVLVADTGPGIPKELQEKIFQPFFTTSRNGNGLGLAISKQIITAHKGTIRVNSFPGGTVFHVQLPVNSA
jgi:signal transduction histidine kinase